MTDIKGPILQAINESSQEINEVDLDALQKEYINTIDIISQSSSKQIYIPLDISGQTTHKKGLFHLFQHKHEQAVNERIVVIGDIHCDFNSLSSIFHKLSVSTYDYFNKAYFIFLGDYIDRGERILETLRLILKLKIILKERCILLRGNHDFFWYNDEEKKYYSKVRPAETINLLNEYFHQGTISKIQQFFSELPFFVLLKTQNRNMLLCHGSIPKDNFLMCQIENTTEQITFEYISQHTLPLDFESKDEKYILMRQFLQSMLWGDPADTNFKYNEKFTRFEFGREQFDSFCKTYGITHLIRGHQSLFEGCTSLFDERCYTVFSSGGTNNEHSYYMDMVPHPCIAIIDQNGNIIPEYIHVYKMKLKGYQGEEQGASNVNEIQAGLQEYIIETDPQGEKKDVNSDTEYPYLNDEFTIKIELPELPAPVKSGISKLLKHLQPD